MLASTFRRSPYIVELRTLGRYLPKDRLDYRKFIEQFNDSLRRLCKDLTLDEDQCKGFIECAREVVDIFYKLLGTKAIDVLTRSDVVPLLIELIRLAYFYSQIQDLFIIIEPKVNNIREPVFDIVLTLASTNTVKFLEVKTLAPLPNAEFWLLLAELTLRFMRKCWRLIKESIIRKLLEHNYTVELVYVVQLPPNKGYLKRDVIGFISRELAFENRVYYAILNDYQQYLKMNRLGVKYEVYDLMSEHPTLGGTYMFG